MRKTSYIIAYWITKLLKENHRFRFVTFYFTQIILTQTFQMSLYLFLAHKMGLLLNFLIIMFTYFISRKFTKHYHATSFEACTIISGTLLLGSTYISSISSIYLGMILAILFNIYSSTINGENQLNKISIAIDKNNKKIKKVNTWILHKLKHL